MAHFIPRSKEQSEQSPLGLRNSFPSRSANDGSFPPSLLEERVSSLREPSDDDLPADPIAARQQQNTHYAPQHGPLSIADVHASIPRTYEANDVVHLLVGSLKDSPHNIVYGSVSVPPSPHRLNFRAKTMDSNNKHFPLDLKGQLAYEAVELFTEFAAAGKEGKDTLLAFVENKAREIAGGSGKDVQTWLPPSSKSSVLGPERSPEVQKRNGAPTDQNRDEDVRRSRKRAKLPVQEHRHRSSSRCSSCFRYVDIRFSFTADGDAEALSRRWRDESIRFNPAATHDEVASELHPHVMSRVADIAGYQVPSSNHLTFNFTLSGDGDRSKPLQPGQSLDDFVAEESVQRGLFGTVTIELGSITAPLPSEDDDYEVPDSPSVEEVDTQGPVSRSSRKRKQVNVPPRPSVFKADTHRRNSQLEIPSRASSVELGTEWPFYSSSQTQKHIEVPSTPSVPEAVTQGPVSPSFNKESQIEVLFRFSNWIDGGNSSKQLNWAPIRQTFSPEEATPAGVYERVQRKVRRKIRQSTSGSRRPNQQILPENVGCSVHLLTNGFSGALVPLAEPLGKSVPESSSSKELMALVVVYEKG